MVTKKLNDEKKISSKAILLSEITVQLTGALSKLKDSLGEKKFEKRIRKAAKLLTEGIKPTLKEKITGKGTSSKKVAKQSPPPTVIKSQKSVKKKKDL